MKFPEMSWWHVHTERTMSDDVPAPPERVRDFYVDLNNIRLVHPLIVSVDLVSSGQTDGGFERTYRVVDRVPVGPFTMAITYRARLWVPVDGDVLTEADQPPGVRLRGVVSFEPIPTGTRVTERVRFSAPRPLAGVTIREGVKAHVEMLAGMRRHFETV